MVRFIIVGEGCSALSRIVRQVRRFGVSEFRHILDWTRPLII